MIKTGHELSEAEIAARYEQLGDTLRMPPYFYSAVAEFIGPVGGATVLDAGCGTGELLVAVQRLNPQAKLCGLELAPSRVESARQRLGPGADIRLGSLNAPLPFAPESADLILVTEVLEHLKEPVAALRHLRRWLRPGGAFIITVPNSSAWLPFSPLAARLAPHFKSARGFLPHEHPLRTEQPIDTVFSLADIRTIVQASDLRVIASACAEVLPYLAEFAYKFTPGWDIAPLRRPFDRLATRLGFTALGYRLMLRCACVT